ncbi:MAG: hypothetical protein ACR2MA_01435, partial [Egibacteraceae bacterium]
MLRDLIVTLADGGVCFADIEALGTGAAPGARVASDSTAWRLVDALAGDELAGVRLADAERAARGLCVGQRRVPAVGAGAARRRRWERGA